MTVINVEKKEKPEVERNIIIAWDSLLSYLLKDIENVSTSQKLENIELEHE